MQTKKISLRSIADDVESLRLDLSEFKNKTEVINHNQDMEIAKMSGDLHRLTSSVENIYDVVVTINKQITKTSRDYLNQLALVVFLIVLFIIAFFYI